MKTMYKIETKGLWTKPVIETIIVVKSTYDMVWYIKDKDEELSLIQENRTGNPYAWFEEEKEAKEHLKKLVEYKKTLLEDELKDINIYLDSINNSITMGTAIIEPPN